jgi:hypothetical protein
MNAIVIVLLICALVLFVIGSYVISLGLRKKPGTFVITISGMAGGVSPGGTVKIDDDEYHVESITRTVDGFGLRAELQLRVLDAETLKRRKEAERMCLENNRK